MATTFAYEVSPYKRRDGTYLIKIRMIHNREIIRKPSNVYVKREQLTRDLSKVKDQAIIEAINQHLGRFRFAVATIQGAEFMKAEVLWNAVIAQMKQKDGFALDFFVYAETKIADMESGTAAGYRTSLNAFKRFLKKDKLDINEITYKMMMAFRTFLENEPALSDGKGQYGTKKKGCRAVSYYLSCLRHIHNLARAEFNDDDIGLISIPRQPFKAGLIPQQPVTEHRALTAEQIRRIAVLELDNGLASLARDVFMLSFMLVGMNTADIYKAEKKDLKEGILTYNRAKTDSVRSDKAMIRIRVEKEAENLMERYKHDEHLFCFADRYSDIKNFNKSVNKGLKRVGEALGIEGLTTYHARHSWATIARNDCRIDFETVHEALNHAKQGSDKITDIYVARDFSKIWEANRKVLDYVLVENEKAEPVGSAL